MSTKTHLIVDGKGRPLVVIVSAGQAGDAPGLLPMLAELRVARRGPGRPRTKPDLLRADKAYSARAHRHELRRRGIKAVICHQRSRRRPRPAVRENKFRVGAKGTYRVTPLLE